LNPFTIDRLVISYWDGAFEQNVEQPPTSSQPTTSTPAPPVEIPVTLPGFGGDETEHIEATFNTQTGVVTLTMNEEAKQTLIDGAIAAAEAAIAEALENGEDVEGIVPVIVFPVSSVEGAIALSFPEDAIGLFYEHEVTILLQLPDGELLICLETLDVLVDAIEELAQQGISGPITIMLSDIKIDDLGGMHSAQADFYGRSIVISIDIFIGGYKVDVPITVSIPYELEDDEHPKGVRVWYLNAAGVMVPLVGDFCDDANMKTFKITHQSYFVVAYDPVRLWINIFSDVKENDWFYEAVAYGNYHNIFKGYGDGIFAPDDLMTRAMMVGLLWALEGQPVLNGQHGFKDVPADSWFNNAVLWASMNKIVNGVSADSFAPDRPVTREEMIQLFYNFSKFKNVSIPENRDLLPLTDYNLVSGYATDAVKALVQAGVINGIGNVFNPRGIATRAESTLMYKNYIKFIGFNGAFEYDESGEAVIPEIEIWSYSMADDCLAELDAGPIDSETAFLVDAAAKFEVTDDNPNGGKSLRVIPESRDEWNNWQGVDLKQSMFEFKPGVKYIIEISGRIAAGGLSLATRKNSNESWAAVGHTMTGSSSGGTFSYRAEITFNASHFQNINPEGSILRFVPTVNLTPFTIDKLTVIEG